MLRIFLLVAAAELGRSLSWYDYRSRFTSYHHTRTGACAPDKHASGSPAVHSGSPAVPPEPVFPCEWADPSMAYFDGTYYAFGGSMMIESTDLQTWSTGGVTGQPKNYLSRTPSWAANWGGAPGAPVKVGSYYVMTFNDMTKGQDQTFCVGTAYARTPAGPYTPASRPLVCGTPDEPTSGAIDPTLRLVDNELYIYYKTQGAVFSLWAAKLHGYAWSLTTSAPAVSMLNVTSGSSWEAKHHPDGIGCIEAPALLQYNHKTYLFYSGGAWGNQLGDLPYSVGYAECDTPLGPCHKVTKRLPWFGPQHHKAVGVGGQDFFFDGAGQPWMVYHAYNDNEHTAADHGKRTMRLAPLSQLPPLTATDPYDGYTKEEVRAAQDLVGVVCNDECGDANNGICQDGGLGANCTGGSDGFFCPPNGLRMFCAFGTDCSDCGRRVW